MALVEGCKHQIEVTVPVEEVAQETERVIAGIQKKAHLRGFRPGKAPLSLIRSQFRQEIRQQVLEAVLPKAFSQRVKDENLKLVGDPNVTDVHFHDGEPLRFTAQFEVAPEIELKEYRGIEVPYEEPTVPEADIEERLRQVREQRAEYVNEDPRPLGDGDHALVALTNITSPEDGEEPEPEEVNLEIGGSETLPAFTEHLRGQSPGDAREFDVTYPEDYGNEALAGKTMRFRAEVRAVRRKEMPELNDEFAQDLGDFQSVDEVRDAVRRTIFNERQYRAQQEARNQLIETMIDGHDFPIPEAYIERQIETDVDQRLRQLAGQGIDPRGLKLDWSRLKEAGRERAVRTVKGSLLLERVAEAEAIQVTNDEVDQEVQRASKQERKPVAALRQQFQKDGTLDRIAAAIRTEKVFQFLFEHARKVPKPAEVAEQESAG